MFQSQLTSQFARVAASLLVCVLALQGRADGLSRVEFSTVYESGDLTDVCRMRLFADDDYGLRALFEFLVEKYGVQVSSPYKLLSACRDALFVGICSPEQCMQFDAQELLDFAAMGNSAGRGLHSIASCHPEKAGDAEFEKRLIHSGGI